MTITWTDAVAKLAAGYWNSAPVSAGNPGGFDEATDGSRAGHEVNFPAALEAVGVAAQHVGVTAAATSAALVDVQNAASAAVAEIGSATSAGEASLQAIANAVAGSLASTVTVSTLGRALVGTVTATEMRGLIGALSAADVDASTINVRLAEVEYNLGLVTLRSQVDAGWSVLGMVNGVADEFEDSSGIGSATSILYDATGDYYYVQPVASGGDLATTGNVAFFANGSGAAAHTDPTYAITKCADNNSSTTAAFVGGDALNSILYVDCGTAKKITGVTVTQSDSANYKVMSAKIVYSDNATTWVDGSSDTTLITTSFAKGAITANTGLAARRYWGVKFTTASPGGSGYGLMVAELEVIEEVGTNSGQLTSVAYTASSAPVEIRAILLHQVVSGSVALNTDLVLSLSRDGGVTWTAATLANVGQFDTATSILVASVSVSGQPAGTSIKWRVNTANGKDMRLHGVWLQWR